MSTCVNHVYLRLHNCCLHDGHVFVMVFFPSWCHILTLQVDVTIRNKGEQNQTALNKSHCRFIKVTWQKLVNGSKQNVAIANPSLGVSVAPPYRDRVTFKNGAVRRRTPNLEDTTISFSSLRLSDEATYICEYTTFPAGNRENTVNLTVYGRADNQYPINKYGGANIQANACLDTVQ